MCTRSRSSVSEVVTNSPMKRRGCPVKDDSVRKKDYEGDTKKIQQIRPRTPTLQIAASPVPRDVTDVTKDFNITGTRFVKIRLRTKIIEVEQAYSLRPKVMAQISVQAGKRRYSSTNDL